MNNKKKLNNYNKLKISIIISRFNSFINKNLLDGALDALKRVGKIKKKNIKLIKVPGAYEIPLVAKILAESKKYDAIIAIGTIIKGDTLHFKYLAKECISNLSKISILENIPISFGVLITKNIEQAILRSGCKMGNKGYEAALASLEMINIINNINN